MQGFIDSHDWLTVYRLPTYAPELNWCEGAWAHAKRGLGNLAARGIDQLAATVKTQGREVKDQGSVSRPFIT
jgi:putative transposase